MLRTSVKLNSVTNLSDARYAVGMGVEYVGFCIDPSKPKYMDNGKIEAIKSWLSGVNIIIEVETTDQPMDDYDSCIIELTEISYPKYKSTNIQYVLRGDYTFLNSVRDTNALFFILELNEDSVNNDVILKIRELISLHPTYIYYRAQNADIVANILNELNPKGICVDGGVELRPGISDFEEMASILEYLETSV